MVFPTASGTRPLKYWIPDRRTSSPIATIMRPVPFAGRRAQAVRPEPTKDTPVARPTMNREISSADGARGCASSATPPGAAQPSVRMMTHAHVALPTPAAAGDSR
ncbi:hypothetical protein GCM10029978_101470 [Actinoallomurus acanthiterrae]